MSKVSVQPTLDALVEVLSPSYKPTQILSNLQTDVTQIVRRKVGDWAWFVVLRRIKTKWTGISQVLDI